jgi:hypothetical protein
VLKHEVAAVVVAAAVALSLVAQIKRGWRGKWES